VDESVFLGSCNGFFRALDSRTGEVKWTYDTRQDGDPVEFHGDPLVTKELVVVGSDLRSEGGAGRVYAFERASGIPRWISPAGQGVATDLRVIGGTLFAVSLADELLALDRSSGSLLWSFATGVPNDGYAINSTPAVSTDRVFFGGLDGALYALEADTGRLIWKRPLGSRVSTSVLLAGGSLYAGTLDNRLHRLEPSTGEPTASLQTVQPPGGRLAAAGSCILAFLGEDSIACAEPSLERIRWSHAPEGRLSSSRPYVWKDFALVGDGSGKVAALRLSDGTAAWSLVLSGTIRGIGIGKGTLYAGTLKGMVFAHSLPASP
jgi:outer membrane protein assembly factor BamB